MNWYELSAEKQNFLCKTKKLPESFIIDIWSELTESQQELLLINQPLSFWTKLTEVQRSLFALYNNGIEKLPLEKLPIFLSDSNLFVRVRALRHGGVSR